MRMRVVATHPKRAIPSILLGLIAGACVVLFAVSVMPATAAAQLSATDRRSVRIRTPSAAGLSNAQGTYPGQCAWSLVSQYLLQVYGITNRSVGQRGRLPGWRERWPGIGGRRVHLVD